MFIRPDFKTVLVLLFFYLLLGPLSVSASGYWWQKSDEGWFFYKDAPPKEKKEEKPRVEKKPEVQPGPPLPLFTEQMKRKGEELLSAAMENPNFENVKAYMEHNYQMMKLSNMFSLLWQKVLMMHPELGGPAPVSDADKDLYFAALREKNREILYRLSREAGLFFFYTTSCPSCERQAYYLERFKKEYPFFIIKPVTLDGGVFEGFPDTVMDNGIATRLGIDVVPAIFLAYPPDRFERISSGLVTTDELKRRLIWYATEATD